LKKKDPHYRLPLKLINSYIWAGLTKVEQAILTVIGAYINGKFAPCSLTRSEIAERVGYSLTNLRVIDNAIKVLVAKYLIIIKKGRPNRYYLTDLSRNEEGRSHFRLYRYQVKGRYWAKLRPCEKTLYPVLYIKGTISHPDIVNIEEICCRGQIKKKKDFCKWTKLNYSSFKRTLKGLEEKSLLDIDDDGNYDLYRLEEME